MSDEMWQILLAGEITDVDLETLRQWIIEGKVQKTDKVRKGGGGSWADVARTPPFRAAFSAASQQQTATPPPVIQVESNYAAETAPPPQQYSEQPNYFDSRYDANTQGYSPQQAYSTESAMDASQPYPLEQPYLPADQPYLAPDQQPYLAPDQPYLPPDQPYLPPDQPYLVPGQTYGDPGQTTENQQPTGTVFQGEAPPTSTIFQGEAPKKFLQAEELPDMFKKSTPKSKRISMEEYASRMTSQQSMVGLLGAGILTAFIGAGIWTIFAAITSISLIWLALGVGYLVGDTCRKYGKCVQQSYGITAGIFGMAGAFLGQLLSTAVIIAHQNALAQSKALSSLNINAAFLSIKQSFGAFNIIILLAAGYIAYYFSFRTDTEMD